MGTQVFDGGQLAAILAARSAPSCQITDNAFVSCLSAGVMLAGNITAWSSQWPGSPRIFYVRRPRTRDDWRKYYRAADACAIEGARLAFRPVT